MIFFDASACSVNKLSSGCSTTGILFITPFNTFHDINDCCGMTTITIDKQSDHDDFFECVSDAGVLYAQLNRARVIILY